MPARNKRRRRTSFPTNFIAGLSSGSEIKVRASELAAGILRLLVELRTHKSRSRVSEQPVGLDEMLEGAINRAVEALAQLKDAWVIITIENGKEEILGVVYDTPLVYIRCRNQLSMEAWGLPFPIPSWLWEKVVKNNSQIGDQIPGANHDPMAFFTNGVLDRAEICAWAIVMAFMPLIYWEQYAGPVATKRSARKVAQFRAERVFVLPERDEALEDIVIGSGSDIKLRALSNAASARNIPCNIVSIPVKPLQTVQPVGYAAIYAEALHRATSSLASYVATRGKMPLYAVGVQIGIVVRHRKPYEISCCVMVAADGYITTSWSMPVHLPEWLWQEYLDGKKLRDGSPWEVGLRIAELDELCEHNTLLFLSRGEIRNIDGTPIEQTFLLEQGINVGFLQHINRELYEREPVAA